MRSIFLTTFLVEGLGCFSTKFSFYSWVWLGTRHFHLYLLAISAFCNAGFDNFGSSSLVAFQTDPLINLVIAGLIITGGLGFMVWFDLATQFGQEEKTPSTFPHPSWCSSWLQGFCCLGQYLHSLRSGTIQERLAISVFQRKCWLAFPNRQHENSWLCLSIDYTQARPVTLFIYIPQMFLGGAPGGTAGASRLRLSLSYWSLRVVNCWAYLMPMLRRELLRLEQSKNPLVSSLSFWWPSCWAWCCWELQQKEHRDLFTSCLRPFQLLRTVGVTANLTPELGKLALSIIMVLMFIGRIGPLTLLVSLADYQPDKKDLIQYMKADISIG